MKGPMDAIMWLFLLVAFVVAIRNPKGFAADVAAPANAGGKFATGIIGAAGSGG